MNLFEMKTLVLICLSFVNNEFQLAPRQEPVLDTAKYTAADVRIVSLVSTVFLSLFSSCVFSLKLLSIIILSSYFCNSAVVNWFLFSFRNFDAIGIEKPL